MLNKLKPVYTCSKIYYQLLSEYKKKIKNSSFLGKSKQKFHITKLYTKSRNSTLLPFCVGVTFHVYNGKAFMKVFVSQNIINHKLGEFSNTRQRYYFKKKKSKK